MKKKDFITQELLSEIYQHVAPLPEKLPPERQLAEKYNVSRFTLRKALEKLADIGAIYRVQGAGNFINQRVRGNPLVYNSISEKTGDQISFRLLSQHLRRPHREEQRLFNITAEAAIWEFHRLRYVDNRKVQFEIAKMPAEDFPDINRKIIEDSIQQYVLAKGFIISHSLTHHRAVSVNKKQAEMLGCKKGIAAMRIINRGILQNGRVYQYSDIIDIDHACTYIIPFNRDNPTPSQA